MSKLMILRVDPELHELIRSVARARGEDMAVLARRAIKSELARLSFLSDYEKKALGVAARASPAPKKEGAGE
jgi:predicted transcriptional regulator